MKERPIVCDHGSLRRQCLVCEAIEQRDAAMACAFKAGAPIETIAQATGLHTHYVDAVLRRAIKA